MRLWVITDPLKGLHPAERILELEVRSGATLDEQLNLRMLNFVEWQAKVKSAEYRAIRLPDEFRVDADELYLRRTPEGLLVIPRDPWEVYYEGVEELSYEFFHEGRVQPPVVQRDWKP